LGSCVREKLVRLRASRAERPTRGAELVLWAQVAANADVLDALRGVFRPGDFASLSVRDAAELVMVFHRAGLTKEILQALGDPMQPSLLYLRSWCLRALGDSVAADEARTQAWTTLTRTVNLDSELILHIGDAMELLGDSEESNRLWMLLVDRTETASVHLVNAYLRLARAAEASGDMALALARCEKALELTRSLGDESARLVAPSGERGTEWLMRTILELRRRVRGITVEPLESRGAQTSP
jgi:tetratricopeptide (TPR) repeat protein